MSDCEGCKSKEAQIVFLANRAAIYREALALIEQDLKDNPTGEDYKSLRYNLAQKIQVAFADSTGLAPRNGLRVELDGKVLIETKETPGAHDRRDDWERGPSKMLKVTRLMDSKGNE